MPFVYLITNKNNGKQYVGQTIKDVSLRFDEHVSASRKGSLCALHRAMRKHGVEKFIIDVMHEENDLKKLDDLEIYEIARLNTNMCSGGRGYNMTSGGRGALTKGSGNGMSKVDELDVLEIKIAWSAEKPAKYGPRGQFYKRYADKFGVTSDCVCQIINGRLWSHVTVENFWDGISDPEEERNNRSTIMKRVGARHEFRQSCRKRSVGEKNGNATLTEDDVRQILIEWKDVDIDQFGAKGTFYREMSDKLGVTPNMICGIVLRKSWQHVAV